MATLNRLDGFEHGRGSTAPRVADTVTGASTTVTSPVRTGARALQIAPAGDQRDYRYTVAANRVTTSFYIRFASLPTANVRLAHFVNANGNSRFRFDVTSVQFAVDVATGAIVVGGPVVAVNTWYLVDLEFDTSTATASLKCRIDQGTEFSSTGSQATANTTAAALGESTTATYTAFYDDWAISVTAGDYPIGPHSILSLIPSADGTHNIATSGDFDSFTTTQFSNATTNGYTFIAHRPLQAANTAEQVIRQELGATTNYMEMGAFEDLPSASGTPVDVRAYGTHVESATAGASVGEIRLLLSDATEVLTTGSISVVNSTEDPGTTVTIRSRMTIRPTGGWDKTKVNGLKGRLGFSDNAPDVNFIDFMVEVYMEDREALPAFINQAGVTFAPTIEVAAGAQTVDPAFINQAGAIFSPTVGPPGLTPGFLDQTAVIFAPSVSPGNVDVSPAFLNQAGVIFSPEVALAGVSPGLIDQAGVTFAPTVSPPTQSVSPAFLDRAGVVFSPVVGPPGSTPGFINQAGVTFEPEISGVSPAGGGRMHRRRRRYARH